MLIAKSGLRKGLPIAMAKKLVSEVNNTRIISGQNTIQGMLQELSEVYTIPGGGIITDAHCYLATDEFESFMISDESTTAILTTLYNTWEHEKEWKKTLRDKKFVLKSPCLTLLGGSHEEGFKDAIPRNSKMKGYVARNLIV